MDLRIIPWSEIKIHAPSLRACFVTLICLVASNLFAAGGTHVIASKGQPVTVSAGWPEGLGEGIGVSSGNVPTVFHRFNTKDEQKREAAEAQKETAKKEVKEEPDPAAREATERIAAFLEKRNRKAD